MQIVYLVKFQCRALSEHGEAVVYLMSQHVDSLLMQAASGSRNAATVYRNAETGARMTKEEYEALEKKTFDKKKPVYEAPAWGGGVRQVGIMPA